MDLPRHHHIAAPDASQPDDDPFGIERPVYTSRLDQLRDWLGAGHRELIGIGVILIGGLVVTAIVVIGALTRIAELPGGQAALPSIDSWDAEHGQPAMFNQQQVTVHVAGAVSQPGVRHLTHGSRVAAAIEAAGGAAADANLDAINLARIINDGEQIIVPHVGDDIEDGHTADGRININRASATQLEALPGIGPARAQTIVEYRESHGPFTAPTDLRAISGIGEATFQRLAELITVG